LYEYVKGGLKKEHILDFYNHFIKDKYKNHLIIMDNVRIHKSKIIRETIEKVIIIYYILFLIIHKQTQ